MNKFIFVAAVAWALSSVAWFAGSLPGQEPQRETVILSFTGDNCPYCRALERTWADRAVQAELTAAKATRTTLNTGGMTQAQLDEWRITGIPVTVIGERLDDGSVRELRRLDGSTTADELRKFIRGVK